ncbi:hypothetical protein [Xanthomonas sacchari]|uniref:hypothetical protein n=1 Tax=Xanthomonas sacchari TaxID=56458 RepID=UPI0022530930|nr:hypothetical protein [Xanthomonas sacchari]
MAATITAESAVIVPRRPRTSPIGFQQIPPLPGASDTAPGAFANSARLCRPLHGISVVMHVPDYSASGIRHPASGVSAGGSRTHRVIYPNISYLNFIRFAGILRLAE